MINLRHKNIPAFKALLLSPASVILAVSLFILAFQIFFIGKFRPFNSDDLYWQQVVRTWLPFSGETLYLGTKDIFVEQIPFFAVMEHLFPASRKLLIVETYLLTAGAFIATYVTALYFMKKLEIKPNYLVLLPFIWLASFGYPIVQNYLNSSWRTLEVGLSMLTFLLVAAYLFRDFDLFGRLRTKLLAVLVVIFIGLLIYSDPYYIFFTIAPILLLASGLFLIKQINRVQLLTIYGAAAIAFVCAKIIELLFRVAGVKIMSDTPSIFINFEQILQNFVTAFHGFLIIYGADFFGRPIMGKDTIIAGINALLVFSLLIIVYLQLRRHTSLLRKSDLKMIWPYFFAALIVFVFLIYSVSTLVMVGNFRFFIISVYASTILLTFTIGLVRHRPTQQIIGAILLLATLGNIGFVAFTHTIKTQPDVKNNIGNALNYTIIDSLKARDVTKGYASYWHGNVNTYLSKGAILSLPSLCTPQGETKRFTWLLDGSQFYTKAKKTFYLIDPDIREPAVCTQDQLIAQFGVPSQIYKVYNKTIMIFDYDITSKMSDYNF